MTEPATHPLTPRERERVRCEFLGAALDRLAELGVEVGKSWFTSGHSADMLLFASELSAAEFLAQHGPFGRLELGAHRGGPLRCPGAHDCGGWQEVWLLSPEDSRLSSSS